MRSHRPIRALAAAALLAATTAGTTLAAKPSSEVRNEAFAFSFVDSEICAGLEIQTSFEGKRSRTIYYDRDGNDDHMVIQVRSQGTFVNLANPGLTVSTMSVRHIVLNFADNTYTDTGVYRNVNTGGQHLLQQTGRWHETLDEGEVLAISGPHQDWLGDTADFCAALAG